MFEFELELLFFVRVDMIQKMIEWFGVYRGAADVQDVRVEMGC